jgi:hypothetical protein
LCMIKNLIFESAYGETFEAVNYRKEFDTPETEDLELVLY